MRVGGGKAKGSAFEREICRLLSLWVSHDTQEDVFWRSATSGGRSTMAFKRGKRLAAQAGDISAVHEAGAPLIRGHLIELKCYQNLDYVGLLSGRGHLASFWLETQKQAKQYNKLPMLISKQNRQPVTVGLTLESVRLFKVRRVLTAPKLDLNLTLLDDFLRNAVRPV